MGWMVNATPRPLYAGEKPGNHCIEGYVGPRDGLDMSGKLRSHHDFFVNKYFIHTQELTPNIYSLERCNISIFSSSFQMQRFALSSSVSVPSFLPTSDITLYTFPFPAPLLFPILRSNNSHQPFQFLPKYVRGTLLHLRPKALHVSPGEPTPPLQDRQVVTQVTQSLPTFSFPSGSVEEVHVVMRRQGCSLSLSLSLIRNQLI
jgi:hypothetical protein